MYPTHKEEYHFGQMTHVRKSGVPKVIHRCDHSDIPRIASGLLNGGSNSSSAIARGANPGCLGMPNF